MRIIKEILCRLLERIAAAVNPITFTYGIPSGAARKGEQVDLYNITTNATANTETVRGVGYTVTAGKTCYITDIWFALDREFVYVYLKAGTVTVAAVTARILTSGALAVHPHLKFATPLAVAAGVVIQFADKASVVSVIYYGAAGWSGFEL